MNPAWLRARQNADGGWGYTGSASAVEPTVEALLALAASGEAGTPQFLRGTAWIAGMQRPDGGWPPRANVMQSTWVTGMVLLLPGSALPETQRAAGTNWLLAETGRESSLVERIRGVLLGGSAGVDVSNEGWPWFPGAAAWTVPTAVAVLALRRASGRAADERIRRRLLTGQKFLLARRCADGGWNHGGNRALGYDASSYPETTGLALLALAGAAGADLTPSLDRAERHLAATQSREAAAWLELGLLAHGRTPAVPVLRRQPATTPEGALPVIAAAAREGRSVLA